MDQRISMVTLGVADQARARRFYVDGLGWQPVFEDGDVAFYQLNGMAFGTWRRDHLVAEANLPPEATVGAVTVSHNVRTRAEVEPILARAAAAGGRVLTPAFETDWGGYVGYVADPDGHAWEVAWNPHWTIAPDGGVTVAV
jgi:uncharacterized protein